MENAIELDWPSLGPDLAKKIVEHYEQYKFYSQKFKRIQEGQSMVKESGFMIENRGVYQLTDWPEHIKFIEGIFSEHNIDKKFLRNITLQRSIDEIPPHTDTFRKMSVIYVVEGPADTVFYKQKDQSGNASQARLFDKSQLTEVSRHRFELNKWYLFNNSAIHGVDNYVGKRTSVLFDLTDTGVFENYKDAVEKIKDSKILFL